MLFNSLHFIYFLPIVWLLYWLLPKQYWKAQNVILILASYYFYACWDYRFLALLIFSTLLDYLSGLQIHNSTALTKKRIWLWFSIIINVGLLGVFKYYNFFIENVVQLLSQIGVKAHLPTLNLLLPIGISFYTFHGLSYVIDIFYKRIEPEKRIIPYALFVSFFPLLVAGPIERATHLLPQLLRQRNFNYGTAVLGLRQMLWGFLKKIVIADNCAEYANQIFNNPSIMTGSVYWVGAFLFAIQIYCDFSGYSDIALGTAKLFGIELLRNFNYPYFSRDIAEFWRRWHISLSSWFKDYVYIPLGGSQGHKAKTIRNVFIIFLLSGFWHGANWTFIAWGFLHVLFIIPIILFNANRNNIQIVAAGKLLPSIKELLQMTFTFILTCIAWLFFRAATVSDAWHMVLQMFSSSVFTVPVVFPKKMIIGIVLFFVIEWIGREQPFAIATFGQNWPRAVRWSLYIAMIVCIFFFAGLDHQFIYFQF
jgi:alginate O-acetyltransferase complex protein AlgI